MTTGRNVEDQRLGALIYKNAALLCILDWSRDHLVIPIMQLQWPKVTYLCNWRCVTGL